MTLNSFDLFSLKYILSLKGWFYMYEESDLDLGLFEQLDEALEERQQGADRRKNNLGKDSEKGTDRRKADRRNQKIDYICLIKI